MLNAPVANAQGRWLRGIPRPIVMAGLVPAIHGFLPCPSRGSNPYWNNSNLGSLPVALFPHAQKSFADLTDREVLALAIQNEEEEKNYPGLLDSLRSGMGG